MVITKDQNWLSTLTEVSIDVLIVSFWTKHALNSHCSFCFAGRDGF